MNTQWAKAGVYAIENGLMSMIQVFIPDIICPICDDEQTKPRLNKEHSRTTLWGSTDRYSKSSWDGLDPGLTEPWMQDWIWGRSKRNWLKTNNLAKHTHAYIHGGKNSACRLSTVVMTAKSVAPYRPDRRQDR